MQTGNQSIESIASAAMPPRASLAGALVGRCFFNPAMEYLLIGGVLSLMTLAVVAVTTDSGDYENTTLFAMVVLLCNSAHFGSSTVRLYSKRDNKSQWPILTMLFPVLALIALSLCIWQPRALGANLQSLYLTWSPYHFAAQAFGLAVMYSHRSGCQISSSDKRLLWWVAMVPCLYAWISGTSSGVFWFVSQEQLAAWPWLGNSVNVLKVVLPILGFSSAAAIFLKIWRSANQPMPLMSLLIIVSNGVWWLVFGPLQAFVWATVFHGIQYLAIVAVFDLKDRMQRSDNQHSSFYHVTKFYLASAALGYALFHLLPWAYTFVGFGLLESALLCGAAISLHHFFVDGFIWKLRRDDGNRRVIEEEVPTAMAAAVTAS